MRGKYRSLHVKSPKSKEFQVLIHIPYHSHVHRIIYSDAGRFGIM